MTGPVAPAAATIKQLRAACPGADADFLTRMRTAYGCQGPNLTRVVYAGVTADGRIAARIVACDALAAWAATAIDEGQSMTP